MQFASYYSRALSDDSGVTAALWSWANALADAGHRVRVLHAGGPRRGASTRPVHDRVTDEAIPHRGGSRRTFRPVGLERYLHPGEVLILHEGWVASNIVAGRAARRADASVVVVPHGVYEPGIRATLKPPRWLRERFETRLLSSALGVHVFYASEGALVHDLAPTARIIVAPTGFEVPSDRWIGGGGYIAWIGRYDPLHKGLDLLLQAIASLDPAERPRIELRGPDYNGGYPATQRMIEALGLGEWVAAAGPVAGTEKLDFLRRADGYVHPSRWESHSIALLENLSMGVPSLVSSAIHAAAPLEAADAALVAPPTPAGLADGLRRLQGVDPSIGDRARAYIAATFAWPAVIDGFVARIEALRATRA